MNTATPEPARWSQRTWWCVGLGLFGVQLLLLFRFGARERMPSRPVSHVPHLGFALRSELLALQDPTLFAQGHPQGFSGGSWMRIFVPEHDRPEWTEPPRWLTLDAQRLGGTLRGFVQTNRPLTVGLVAKPAPPLASPEVPSSVPATARPSMLRIEGVLAARRLLREPNLGAWEHPDLLTNSVVRVLVDAAGAVVSPVLLVSSGKPEADAAALALARSAQFEPLPRAEGTPPDKTTLSSGRLIFGWQTLPQSPADASPAKP